MVVSVCKIEIMLYSRSLKEKRRVIKSLLAQIRSRKNVSAAEVGLQDNFDFSIVGLSSVSDNRKVSESIIDQTIRVIENSKFEFEIIKIEREVALGI